MGNNKFYAVSVDVFNYIIVAVFDNEEQRKEWCNMCTDFEICRCAVSLEKAQLVDSTF